MICDACGIEAPTKNVTFNQNIGVLVVRFTSSVSGDLCKACVHGSYWKTTAITFFAGPWGMISLFLSIAFVIGNTVSYLGCLGMPGVPPGAARPRLTDDDYDALKPHEDELFDRLNRREDADAVMTDIAEAAGVTPGTVLLFTREVIAEEKARELDRRDREREEAHRERMRERRSRYDDDDDDDDDRDRGRRRRDDDRDDRR